MKANELMIGDWVHLKYRDWFTKAIVEFDFKVTQLPQNYGLDIQVWGYSIDGRHHGNMGDVRNVLPIPLTPEILEKNGWRYNDAPFVQGWEQYGITIINNRITCGQNVSMKVEFVHELQHALRLCGIEKEIVL